MSAFDPVAAAQQAVQEFVASHPQLRGMSELDQCAAYVQATTGGKGLLRYQAERAGDPQLHTHVVARSVVDERLSAYWHGRGLSTRAAHCLAAAGCASLDDLRGRSPEWVASLRAAGAKTVREISGVAGWTRPSLRENVDREAQRAKAVPLVMETVPLNAAAARQVVDAVFALVFEDKRP
jgi:hypothetical protein